MYYNLNAIILSREAVRDEDLLVTVYTKERGKLRLQARGAKKIKSKLAGHLEPVSLSYLNATIGKNIDQLIGAQSIEIYKNIKSNFEATTTALWCLNFLTNQTFENEHDEPIFNLMQKILQYLDSEAFLQDNFDLIKIAFGYKLLYLLGHDPSCTGSNFELKADAAFINQNKLNKILEHTEKININKLLLWLQELGIED